MIGDHRGRSAGRATLRVRAADGILGTHTAVVIEDEDAGQPEEFGLP